MSYVTEGYIGQSCPKLLLLDIGDRVSLHFPVPNLEPDAMQAGLLQIPSELLFLPPTRIPKQRFLHWEQLPGQ
jgi:hypothetical protein